MFIAWLLKIGPEMRYVILCTVFWIGTMVPYLCAAYKPVVLIHGVLRDPQSLKYLGTCIEQAHPGTNITILNLFNGDASLLPMWYQVKKIRKHIEDISDKSPEGIHLIGYSQGGILARGVIHSMSNHNIDTFISIGGPLMGQYGDPTVGFWKIFDNVVTENIYRVFYTKFGQLIAIGGYWRDPHHLDLYKKYSQYLAILNNETTHANSTQFKENFLKLKTVVLIGSPDDDTIIPWQSSHFGFYKDNCANETVEMRDQEIYKQDSFGLKTLDKRGSLNVITIPNVNHNDLVYNKNVIQNHILPWLT